MKTGIIHLITAVLVVIPALSSAAKDGIYGSAGLSLVKSKDDNISQQYYRPFAVIGWSDYAVDVSASYSRWISYTITDAVYDTREIDISQPGAGVTVYAGDMLSLSGGYSYFSGESSYTAHKITGELSLDFEKVEISLESSRKATEYDFNGTVKITGFSTGGEISIDVTDTVSCDLGYRHDSTDYETYGYTYTKNSVRLGMVSMPEKNLFFLCGISGGNDSDNIPFAALDAGLTVKLFDHLKLSAAYMLTAEFISGESVRRGKMGSSSTVTTTTTDFFSTGYISASLYF